MDDADRTFPDADLLLKNGRITALGPDLSAQAGAEVIAADTSLVTPCLVNTLHHLYQTLTRAVPAVQNALLFGWLQTPYPIWARLTPEHMRVSAQVGPAELALSGCTPTSDHLYLSPNASRLDHTIDVARAVGLRFHRTRGALSIGASQGGLPPHSLVEREADILDDCLRVIDAFHDPAPGSMCRVGVAPSSPFRCPRI